MGARLREFLSGQSSNKTRRKLIDGLPYEVVVENLVNTSEIKQLSDEEKTGFNNEVKLWAATVLGELSLSISESGIEGTELRDSLRSRFKSNAGSINRIGFSFRPHGVYVHKGVGRGYEIRGNVVVRTATGRPDPHEKFPKPWFNPVLSTYIPDLEKIVEKYYEQSIINTVRIYIP